jgi:hypothetical protein
MTSDADWNLSFYDNDVDNMEQFYDASADVIHHDNFDQYGEYCHCTVANHATITDEEFFDALPYYDLEDMIDDIVDNNNITDITGDYMLFTKQQSHPLNLTFNCYVLCLDGFLQRPSKEHSM